MATTPLRLVFDPVGDVLSAARECEEQVFARTYGNTADELLIEYGPYEDATVFMAVADASDDVVAVCRLIVPGPAGLKSLDDAGRPPWQVDGVRAARAAGIDPARTWDIATIGVRPDRGAPNLLTAAALYHGIVVATRVNRIRSVVMIMDERARRLLSAVGVRTNALPGTRVAPYLGSPASTPLYLHLAEMLDHQRRANPEGYRLVGQGLGLDGVTVPEPDAFRLDDRVTISDVVPQLASIA
jgi:hypothetical protein